MSLVQTGLELATFAAKTILMPMHRILLLCFLTATLALTGPFSRGLSSKAAVFPQPVELVHSGAMANAKTGAVPSKRCQRGAITWSNCTLDTGYTASTPRLILLGTARSFETQLGGAADNLRSSRIFRPPRSR
ncbi:hypothetical protein IMCC20628_02656 [Hoeflea sp. IMCC20628]|uniref:hypothetical protein n=1 Tax=Hoeflea sp. IMCC20628 TaxID=1620421 RepID=UPI00063BF696|nr:hypothetical protein [Hoeflea sp. IMCC20628]AKI01353.1 hypothetical protein IMCC20628_02656 [Hoeflea sp. IMCC20628]